MRELAGLAIVVVVGLLSLVNNPEIVDSVKFESQKISGPAKVMKTSWYGPGFHGRQTARGDVFNMYDATAAHRSLPFGTKLLLVNPINGRQVTVEVTDRGPYIKGRDLDISWQAARQLDMVDKGVMRLNVVVLEN